MTVARSAHDFLEVSGRACEYDVRTRAWSIESGGRKMIETYHTLHAEGHVSFSDDRTLVALVERLSPGIAAVPVMEQARTGTFPRGFYLRTV